MWPFTKKPKIEKKEPIVTVEHGAVTVNISRLVASESGQRSLAAVKRLRENLQGKNK